MTEPYLPHNRRARDDFPHHILTYTLRYTQLYENSWSGFMFGDTFHIRYLDNFSNSLIILERSFMLTFLMAYLDFLYFLDLALVLRARAVTNPFPDLPNFPFESEDVVSVLFIQSNFFEMFKVTHLSLPLISLCFLTLRQPQIFMFTDWNKSCLPVNFPSQSPKAC